MESQYARVEAATAGLDGPVAVVDLEAFDANAEDLVRRAGGTPIRVASKSVRCRALLRRVLDRPGFAGVLGFTVAEALWLAEELPDVVVGYPSAERSAMGRLARSAQALDRVTVMIDSLEGLRLVRSATDGAVAPVRVCIDLDAALRIGPLHLGPRRSPVRTPADALALAQQVVEDRHFRLVGLMAYEGQVAGLPDRAGARTPVIKRMKAASVADLRSRRAAIVAAVRGIADLEFVNGGGTGSLETTTLEQAVTEVAAGSGLYGPALFDGYITFRPRPAALFGLDVVRRPAAGIVTVAGGGWIASGPVGADRVPVPTYPEGLAYVGTEGAGEVQTPLTTTADLRIGDRVWFRHAKAGELCERVDALQLIDGASIAESVPTYRGEGRTFL